MDGFPGRSRDGRTPASASAYEGNCLYRQALPTTAVDNPRRFPLEFAGNTPTSRIIWAFAPTADVSTSPSLLGPFERGTQGVALIRPRRRAAPPNPLSTPHRA